MDNETFQVFEWRIENISYWNTNVHGERIKSPQSSGLDHVQQLELSCKWSSYVGTYCIYVIFYPGKTVPSSGGNLWLLRSDGSVIFTQRTHTAGWNNEIVLGLKLKDFLAIVKNKKDQLILRLSFLSSTGNVDTVSTTLAFLNTSMSINLLSVKNVDTEDSKDISIIHYNEENYLDEMLLKAVRKNESIELLLKLLFKSGRGVSVEGQWRLQSSDGTITRNKSVGYSYFYDELLVSSFLLSELNERDISVLLDLKIFCGNKIENRIETTFKEICTVPKKTVCFFDHKSIAINDPANKGRDSSSVLKSDLMRLLKDPELSDLTLKCGDVTYPVHRVILGARSPVFKSMLTCDMREAASGLVDIGDLDPSTLSRFLTFLYTGTAEDLQCDSALNLYYAAEKYQVPSLKSECAEFLCSNVSFSNLCNILSFAYKHGDEALAKVSQDFLLDNYYEVLRSKEWKSFAKDEPSLALKTLCRLGEQNYVVKMQ